MKKLLIFDLDGTLTESKADLSPEMAVVVERMLLTKQVAIISGCNFNQMKQQFFSHIQTTSAARLRNLFLLPTSGGELWTWDLDLKCQYSNELTLREKAHIYLVFHHVNKNHLSKWDYKWGEIAEDRKSQVTFSMLGQNAPLEEKKKFDPDMSKRKEIVRAMQALIPEFEIRIGGATSIDVTKPGINKAYGIQELLKHTGLTIEDCVYIGDALEPGGNDAIVKTLGVDCIPTTGPADTEKIINTLLP